MTKSKQQGREPVCIVCGKRWSHTSRPCPPPAEKGKHTWGYNGRSSLGR